MPKTKKHTPPESTLPLTWKAYNGCREMSSDAIRANLALAPLGSLKSFTRWASGLSLADWYAWFVSIGWTEGAGYCRNPAYLKYTGYPMLVKDVERFKL
jgi:hypothetical protein